MDPIITPETFKAYSDQFIEVVNNQKYDKILSEQIKLEFYGLYKFSMEGPCNIQKPNFLNYPAVSKYNAWNDLSEKSKLETKEEAMELYVEKFKNMFPDEEVDFEGSKNTVSFELGKNFGKTMSTLNNQLALNVKQDNLPGLFDNELSKTPEINLFLKLVQEDNLEAVQIMHENNNEIFESKDMDENTCLHWAADRASMKFLEFFKDKFTNFDVNSRNKYGETALHLASEVEVFDILVQKFGVDESIKDNDGEVAEL